jgi:S1-C subfamily serine protease
MRKDTMPCEGTEIVVKLEASGTGTQITVVQSGFGAFFDIAANLLGIGWDMIVKDLALFVERGLIAHRHFGLWGPSLGCSFVEKTSGLEIARLDAGGLAAKAGMANGDHVLALRSVPVVNSRDVAMVMRTFKPGDEVALSWLRGPAVMAGTATL